MTAKLIGICGLAGSGKDTIGNYLVDTYGFNKTSFASKLKDITAELFGWDRAMVEGATKDSRLWRETEDEWWTERLGEPVTARKMLQKIGTEAMRQGIHNDIWVAATEKVILDELAKGMSIVITDVRFPNEIESIIKLGGIVIQVQRGELPAWYHGAMTHNTYPEGTPQSPTAGFDKVHPSEWKWIGNPYISHTVENNHDLDNLYSEADYIIHVLYERLQDWPAVIEHGELHKIFKKMTGMEVIHHIDGVLNGSYINPIIDRIINDQFKLTEKEGMLLARYYPKLSEIISYYDDQTNRPMKVHWDVVPGNDIEKISNEILKFNAAITSGDFEVIDDKDMED